LVIPRLQVGQVAVNICRCLDYACVKQLNPHTNTPLAAVLQALQSTAAVPFAEAHPLPAAVNHSLEFLDCERRAVLPAGTYHPIERNLWQFGNYLARVCKARSE
jgi:hypothetical protein